MLLEKSKQLLGTRPMLFFSIIMIIKSSIAWMVIFENGSSWALLLKELPFILIIYSIIDFFAKKRKLLYYFIANLIMTTILFSVIMYYKYYGVIVTYFALAQVNQVTAVKNSVFSLLDPHFLFIYTDIVILAFILFRKKIARQWKQSVNQAVSRKVALGLLSVSLILCLFNVLPNRASMNEIVKAEKMGILNYEAYMILAKKGTEYVDPELITQSKINSLKKVQQPAEPILFGAAEGKNLIIIQMESFQNFLVNLSIEGQEITPNFNKLVNNNYYFNHFYQQIGQGNTSDAEYVVNTSLYIPPRGAATQMYADRELPSLPKLLEELDYDTATFHTNVVEFWNRGELYESLGFNNYYDAEYFGNEDTIFFGPSDDVLYEKTLAKLEEMNAQENPFYAHVISMTAHHPYTLPADKQLITLPERYHDTLVGNYMIAQHYADHALGKFIDELKASGIWDESIVLLYGDHLGLPMYSLNSQELSLMEEIIGREYSYADMINIPLVVSLNNEQEEESTGQVLENVGGQVDVLPTVANLLGLDLSHYLHFGQDLFNQTSNILPQRYYLPTGSFLTSAELFLSGSGFEDGTHYPLIENDTLTFPATEDDYERALELLHLSDSYVHSLPLKKKGKEKAEK